MRGAYSVLPALLVVASSQLAAECSNQPQAYDHNVMAAGNAVAKSRPERFLRASRDVPNDLANDERSIYTALASMINEGIRKMPHAAKAAEVMPHAAEAVEEMPHAAEAVEETPQAAKAMKESPHQAKVVKEMPHAKEAMMEMRRTAEAMEETQRAAADDLIQAIIDADEALKKHWRPSGKKGATKGTSRVPNNAILSIPEWKIDFRGTKPIEVHEEHKAMIDPVYTIFRSFCDENLEPTKAEVSSVWRMLEWQIPSHPKKNYRQTLLKQAKRYVVMDVRKMSENAYMWIEWRQLPESLKSGVLDYLLNLHYQRWVRMYNIFVQHRPDQKAAHVNLELTLGRNTGPSSAMALHGHSNFLNSNPFGPFNVASAPKGDHFVSSKRLKPVFDRNTLDGNAGPSSAMALHGHSKFLNSNPFGPFNVASAPKGDHLVSSKRLKRVFDRNTLDGNTGPSSAMALHGHSKFLNSNPYGPFNVASAPKGDHFVSSKRLKRVFDRNTFDGNTGPSSAMALHGHSKFLNSNPFGPFNVATAPKGDHFVSSKRLKRAFDGNIDTSTLPSKQSKRRSSRSAMPPLTRSTTPGDHSVSTRTSRFSFGGAKSAFVPYKRPNVHGS